jgi:hypothetical protein
MLRWIVLGITVSMLLASCSTAAITPSSTVTTLSPDAERLFSLSWEPIPERDGAHVRLRGYLENLYGETAARVQLLAQALDTSSNVVDQKIEWVPGTVSAFGRVYYEIPNMRAANQYRVTVWAFDRGRGPSSADEPVRRFSELPDFFRTTSCERLSGVRQREPHRSGLAVFKGRARSAS